MNRPGVGVGVFVIKDKKFLMVKRKGAHGSGTWSVPGGWMEYGESFEDTSKREVKEEVGIEIKNVNLAGVTNNIFPEDNLHSLTLWMISEYKNGDPKILEPEKISQIVWKDFNNLPQPLFLPWDELLKSKFISIIRKQLQ